MTEQEEAQARAAEAAAAAQRAEAARQQAEAELRRHGQAVSGIRGAR
ncbi:hypothetical protein ACH4VM_24660 [Streptomyces sp. NPDC020792]